MDGMTGWLVIAGGGLIVAYSLLSLVARFTPTPADDKIVSAIGRFFNLLFKKANVSDDDVERLKKKALAIALEELKHKLKNMGKPDEFTEAVSTAAHKALVIEDNGIRKNMRIAVEAVEDKLAQQAEGRIMHTRLGRRLQKKLLRRRKS